MRSLNKVFLMGRLGQQPQLEESTKGTPFTRLSLATHRSRKSPGDNTWQETTDWHSVSVWGRQAQTCVDHLTKGSLVLVEGDIRTYTVERDEQKQSRLSIQAQKVTFLNPLNHPAKMVSTEAEMNEL